jgi:hypothetical protein
MTRLHLVGYFYWFVIVDLYLYLSYSFMSCCLDTGGNFTFLRPLVWEAWLQADRYITACGLKLPYLWSVVYNHRSCDSECEIWRIVSLTANHYSSSTWCPYGQRFFKPLWLGTLIYEVILRLTVSPSVLPLKFRDPIFAVCLRKVTVFVVAGWSVVKWVEVEWRS